MNDKLKQFLIILITTIIASGIVYFIGASEEYVSSLYSDHCYISGNEPKQMKHKITFEVYGDCIEYINKGLKSRKEYGN